MDNLFTAFFHCRLLFCVRFVMYRDKIAEWLCVGRCDFVPNCFEKRERERESHDSV